MDRRQPQEVIDVLREHVLAYDSLDSAISGLRRRADVMPTLFLPRGRQLPTRDAIEILESWRPSPLPPGDTVVVYHATEPAVARRMAVEGVIPQLKSPNLAMRRYESGERAEFAPGRGVSRGIYVGASPEQLSGYGRAVVEIRVPRHLLRVSPEQAALGETDPMRSLETVDGAVIESAIPMEAIDDLHGGERGLRFNPRPSHHRLRDLIPNVASLSFRDRDELLRRVRELDALEERALRAYERRDYALAERIDAEYAERADELEGLAAELSEDLVEDDVEPGEWDEHPMGRGHVPGPEGATDLNAELAVLYHEYLYDRSPHSRFEAAEHFRSTPFPVETREDVLAYLALHAIEAAHGRPVDVVDKTLLIEAAKDAHERRAELRGRPGGIQRNPSAGADEVFDEAFDRIEDIFPDVGTIEFWEDEAAGADNGAGADRQFAYCKDGNPILIAFAPKATQLSREQLVGLMRHEFGHAMEYRFGVAELERRLGVQLPATVERRADVIAEVIWGEPIVYDERLIQCVSKNTGIRPRPAHLPDERAVLRANGERRRWIIDMLTKSDAKKLRKYWNGATGASHRVVRSPSDRRYWALVREGVPLS